MNSTPSARTDIQILPPAAFSEKLLFRVFDHVKQIGYARLARKNSRRSRPDNVIDMFNPDGFDCYELKMIEIAQNYRHQGVGTTLLNEIIHYCRERNIQRLTGEIKGDDNLHLWYRHHGFTVSENGRIELCPAAGA